MSMLHLENVFKVQYGAPWIDKPLKDKAKMLLAVH